jgi:hypothetical protein
MRRVLILLAAALVPAPAAAASAAERRLLVNGDSLAEGTRPYVPKELPDWRVRQSTRVSRHTAEGADVMRRYGRSLARVIHVSLGTNDDPGQTDAFRSAVGDVMDVAGAGRCVVWANIVRPPYRGVSYRGYNRVLAQEDERRAARARWRGLEFEDLAQLLEGRASAPAARLLYPDWVGPIPRGLPPAPCPANAGDRGGLS